MATKRKSKNKYPKANQGSEGKQAPASKLRIEQLVTDAIGGIEKRLKDEKTPPTIGDYLKVMQLQKELEEEQPKEIKVTWVTPEPESKSGK